VTKAERQEEMVKSYRDLIVWQKSMQLVTQVYLITKSLPKEELYGLVPQIRKSCISIPSNIAEGYGRNSTSDYLRFLQIASGSLYELQTQLEICLNLGYLSKQSFEEIYEQSREIERMLGSLIKKVGSNK
jgi:four helix bundle protein